MSGVASVSMGTAAGSSADTAAASLLDGSAVAAASAATAGSAAMWAPVETSTEGPTGCAAVCKESEAAATGAAAAATAAAAAGLFLGMAEAALLEGCLALLGASGLSSKPGASCAARSSELVGEGGGKGGGVGVTPLLGLPLRGRAVVPCGPCQHGSLLTDVAAGREAGMAASLRGLPLGFAALTAAATTAASAAASAGVLHQHPHTCLARSNWTQYQSFLIEPTTDIGPEQVRHTKLVQA